MRLINYISINSKDWQSCYSSQLYGTFFSIYVKPNVTQCKSNNEKIYLNSLELRIVNYKGLVNLEISRMPEFVPDENGDGCTINVEVQALHHSCDKTREIECHRIELTKCTSPIRFHRFVKPMHPNENGIPVALKNGVFDSMFYQREGIYPERDYPDGEPEFPPKSKENTPNVWADRNDVSSTDVLGDGGIICPYSWIYLA